MTPEKPLKDSFNKEYQASKGNDFVLDLYYSTRGGSTYISVDFMTQTMLTRTGSSDGGLVVTPFSLLDRDMLNGLRETLKSLGGKPPELTTQAPPPPRKQGALNP